MAKAEQEPQEQEFQPFKALGGSYAFLETYDGFVLNEINAEEFWSVHISNPQRFLQLLTIPHVQISKEYCSEESYCMDAIYVGRTEGGDVEGFHAHVSQVAGGEEVRDLLIMRWDLSRRRFTAFPSSSQSDLSRMLELIRGEIEGVK